MLEGEKQALLTQVTQHIMATEKKLRGLGLEHIKVGLYDERTRGPINNPNQIIDMAEGRCFECSEKYSKEHYAMKHTQRIAPPEGGEPIVGAEGLDR